jgi:ribose 5-phosphate isomerase A
MSKTDRNKTHRLFADHVPIFCTLQGGKRQMPGQSQLRGLSQRGETPYTGCMAQDLLTPIELAKRAAAARALEIVEPGMRLGLGTGSTAAWFVRLLGEQVAREGFRVTTVATSARTAEQARKLGIPLVELGEAGWLDLTVDGTDEFDPKLNLIKGGGGALLREKIVANASDRMIVIADDTKEVPTLGAFPLPVEIVQFGWEVTRDIVEEMLEGADVLGREVRLRMNRDQPFVTDGGNYVLDLHLKRINNPPALSLLINQVPGVVENGLFIDTADIVILGRPSGETRVFDLEDEEDETGLFDPEDRT